MSAIAVFIDVFDLIKVYCKTTFYISSLTKGEPSNDVYIICVYIKGNLLMSIFQFTFDRGGER